MTDIYGENIQDALGDTIHEKADQRPRLEGVEDEVLTRLVHELRENKPHLNEQEEALYDSTREILSERGYSFDRIDGECVVITPNSQLIGPADND